MSSNIIRRALKHYSALADELREQERAEADERLRLIARLDRDIEQMQVADKLRRYGMVVR